MRFIPVIFQVASLLAALTRSQSYLYPSSFKLLLCWLRSLAAALQIEIYWVYAPRDSLPCRRDPS
ncbi:hypothetical protein [Photorhabdus heterorhabditis]|uniref:hypothetical protein n=1 Tax=Photorhabdus heterorhabditis TaxID=880156 RepID=UPI001561FE96|nr:hypothetical protein [Photorhabdus heterorhabditis]NRN27009.1 hypothetical protein [Photorhabdus heterorhabditis subsp. aluminescens]